MARTQANPLRECGKPLFFRVENAAGAGIRAPAMRLRDAVRLYVRSLSVMQKEALVTSARTGMTWRLASDEGAYLAGLDEAPCPLAFFTTGMVCSFANEILDLAAQRGITIDSLRLIQDNYYTMTGSALRGTMRGGAKDVDLTAGITAPADAAEIQDLVACAVRNAAVDALLHEAMSSLFTLTHNGAAIETGTAMPIDRPAEPDPMAQFDAARPAQGDWSGLVTRTGMTPKAGHSVTLANDSLREEQDRILHLRGICTLTDTGIKQVDVHLYNPHGSIFRLLCDEAPGNGGAGRAPDALSYLATGIGFCFMTQFGRYAKIARKDLRSYRIVQDTHCSPADAPAAARFDPVETHVHLDSGESDAFARTILAMSEQTCFLHALCKASLAVNVAVQPYGADTDLPPPRGLTA